VAREIVKTHIHTEDGLCRECGKPMPCLTLRLHAIGCHEHEGFRDEWQRREGEYPTHADRELCPGIYRHPPLVTA
jgi:hypothetical protein